MLLDICRVDPRRRHCEPEEIGMDTLTEDWEILAMRTNSKLLFSLLMLIAIPFFEVAPHSSVTWKIRQKSTGLVRLTANSVSEAAEKVRQGFFDSPRARLRWPGA